LSSSLAGAPIVSLLHGLRLAARISRVLRGRASPDVSSVSCAKRDFSDILPLRSNFFATAVGKTLVSEGVDIIRHWEVTARVQKGFLSLFSSFLDFCLLFLIFLLTWASMFGLLGASVEVCTEVLRVRAST